jgi:hypothetical protein
LQVADCFELCAVHIFFVKKTDSGGVGKFAAQGGFNMYFTARFKAENRETAGLMD